MKLVVLSDSHSDTKTIEAIRRRETDADAVFHCGDSELTSDAQVLEGIRIVQGNCDWGARFEDAIRADVAGRRVLMVHGHRHGVKESLLQLKYAAAEAGADIVLFGHSHLYGAEREDGLLYVNPGSTVQPRGGRAATYAVIEDGDALTVTFKDPLSGAVVETAQFSLR
ncbi:metallophosphoesterase [Sporosarcina trichiuri]|uniref:metallophosphoesterase n=1 Tax=Sporosarcina trichiuri TaxID=3056445 RepID=UPI0025B44726|nr:metallophosphoesterase [Sporosarcina sp. 0.2-SM1T-5]WJY28048.1 metallophosphoesterase [Sporosarcina sp. 0.2-SM1T-5]